ncbi:MAG: helix-turn-helix domain-containing protein [Pirellulales bacterium]
MLITARELATMLAIGERTLWRLLASGKLVAPVKIGGATRWRVEDVEAWIEAGCPVPESRQNA